MIVVRHERWAIAIVSCILGFMVVTQYKMTQDNIEENIRLQRTGDLAVQLREAQSERDALLKQIESLKKSGANGGGKADEQLMMKAALTNVKGPGVSVLIEDSLKPVQSGENPNLYVIHDEDILRIVNELRAGGAEAIAINDQRLIGTSENTMFRPDYYCKWKGLWSSLYGESYWRSKDIKFCAHYARWCSRFT